MSMENAVKFVQKLRNDQELYTSFSVMQPAEVLKAAAEMKLPLTEEELKAALNQVEVSTEEMDKVAGGGFRSRGTRQFTYCPNGPDNKHNWEKIGHEEVPATFLFWDYTNGYDIFRCTYCGMEIRNHT